jgi:hypothetical protein
LILWVCLKRIWRLFGVPLAGRCLIFYFGEKQEDLGKPSLLYFFGTATGAKLLQTGWLDALVRQLGALTGHSYFWTAVTQNERRLEGLDLIW